MSPDSPSAHRLVSSRASIVGAAILLGLLSAVVPGAPAGAAGSSFVTQHTLTASDGATNDYFGYSAAISDDGNTAVVGAPDRGSFLGAIYAYARDGGGAWSQQGGAFTVSGGKAGDSFGRTIALSGDGTTALVGAINRNSSTGGVYVFFYSAGAWSQQGSVILGSDSGSGDLFGRSVALSFDGNTALIGASGHGTSAGAAYVFTRSGTTWTQQAGPLTPGGSSPNDAFGTAAALSGDGNTALVGADARNNGQGAAYIFTRTGSTWSQQGSALTASGGQINDTLGISAALSADGNTALIGAYGKDNNRGGAYVFTRTGSTWSQQGSLTPVGADSAGNAQFGVSVDLTTDGNTALIGAYGRSANRGAAYAFTRTASTWSQQGWAITPPGVMTGDQFGLSVSTSSDASTVLVGANGTDNFTGAVSVLGQASSIATGTVLTSNKTPGAVNDPVTYTATVSPIPDGGTMAFKDGASTISGCGSVAVNVNNGNAACQATYGAPGSHSIVATFSGHAPFDTSASDPLSESILAPTTTTLSANHNPANVDQQVAYTATVSPAPSGGTMSFTDGGAPVDGCGSRTVNTTTGVATCQQSYPEGGSHTMVATYSSFGPYGASHSDQFVETVQKIATSTSLASSHNPSTAGQLVTFTATVEPTPDGGNVAFSDHGAPMNGCESIAVSGNQAVCAVSFTPGTAGRRTIVASYQGDARYADSNSPSLSQTVRLELKTLKPAKNAKLKVGKQADVSFQLADVSGKAIPDGNAASFAQACDARVTLGKLKNKCAKYDRGQHRFEFSTKLSKTTKTGSTNLSVRVEIEGVLVASASEPVKIVK